MTDVRLSKATSIDDGIDPELALTLLDAVGRHLGTSTHTTRIVGWSIKEDGDNWLISTLVVAGHLVGTSVYGCAGGVMQETLIRVFRIQDIISLEHGPTGVFMHVSGHSSPIPLPPQARGHDVLRNR